MKHLLSLLLLLSFSFAQCGAEINHSVVAVVGEGGGLVDITIRTVPGHGQEYVGLLPYAGVSTQQSIKYAVSYARAISTSDSTNCDVLVNFGKLPSGEYVDGPSAGAAVAVLSYAVFENLSVRDDTVVTGSLEPGGLVGSVGGLYEKARGSAESGKKYFITPFNNVYEFITLKQIEEDYGITIIQANMIHEIIGFMVHDEPISEREVTKFDSSISENTSSYHYDAELEHFEDIAYRMIEFENYSIQRMPYSEDTIWINEYFTESINEQLDYIDMGYYFTAANDAFLNYIEISTINVLFGEQMSLIEKKKEIDDCLDNLERPKMTSDNFEWVVGSDLRKAWAEDRLNSTNIYDSILVEEKYTIYNALMYSDAWCRVSQTLAEAAEDTGTEINESAWKELAEERITYAESLQHSDETRAKLKLARKEYSQGLYGAAILDATYAIGMDRADTDLLLLSEEEILDRVSEYLEEERSSLWGKVYQSQAVFLTEQKNPNHIAAYRLFVYARELDYSTGQMENSMKLVNEPESADLGLAELILIFLLFSFVLLFILPKMMKRRSYGNSSKKRRGADRAQQDKVRTGAEKKLPGKKRRTSR